MVKNFSTHAFGIRSKRTGCALFIFILASGIFAASALEQKKFVIVITTYNNAAYCIKNLETIFFQKNPDNTGFYENYRIIIVDDASLDGNAEYIDCYMHACNQQHRVTLIKNKERKRAMANLYYALQMCEPDEIVFNYDGDDWLADDQVFNLINTIYQDSEIWLTFGSFINWPTNQMGYCKPVPQEYIDKQLYRKKWWMPGQLRTFYAWLFHQVQLKDLIFEGPYYQGQFFPTNCDLAIYYPMMEMAGNHFKYIPEVIYIRNVETPINDFKANKDVQVLGSKILREKPVYPPLENTKIDYFKPFEQAQADIILFSDQFEYAQKCIESCSRLVLNYHTIYIIHPINDQRYQLLAKDNITLKGITEHTFKNTVVDLLQSTHNHVLFAHDTIIATHYIDCNECIRALEKTFAYGFYLSNGIHNIICHRTGMPQPMPVLNKINPTMYAWTFGYTVNGDWSCYNNPAMTLYRTKDILPQINGLNFSNYRELFSQWAQVPIDLENVGVCYEHARVGYIHW